MTEVLSSPASYKSSSSLRRSGPSQSSLLNLQQSATSSRPDKKHKNSAGLSSKHRSLSSPSKLDTLNKSHRASSSKPKKISNSQNEKSKKVPDLAVNSNVEPLFPKYKPTSLGDDENEDSDFNAAPPSSPLTSSISPDEHIASLPILHKRTQTIRKAEDDSVVQESPSRHVDYLSHEFKEEEIWSSWRFIVSQRSQYGERSRLENASWRTWAKKRDNLRTVDPRKLNWYKDCDVTWLYGPLQIPNRYIITQQSQEGSYGLSKSNSFLTKKPILKKRSVSEMMLQRSLSTSSLIRQAAAAVQAQQESPFGNILRRPSEYLTDTISSRSTLSREGTDYFSSQSTSGFHSPASEFVERRHIRFDNKVEQFLAVGEYEEEEIILEEDSSPDEGLLMKQRLRKRRPKARRKVSVVESKIITKLPDTILKDRVDLPVSSEAQSHSLGSMDSGSGNVYKPKLSPSISSETLRPKDPSKNYLIRDNGDEVDDDDDESEEENHFHWVRDHENQSGEGILRNDSSKFNEGKLRRISSGFIGEDDEDAGGLRRTASGMFMPVGNEEDPNMGGLMGRVLDTVNTAKDIAHVIWNVGWRR